MDNELKKYIHHYLGCEIMEIKTGDIMTFDDLQGDKRWPVWTRNKKYCDKRGCCANGFKFKEIKLLLRPLSDMTPMESEYILPEAWDGKPTIIVNAAMTVWLLSRHFDLFGLIDAGLALDKTKLQK